MTTPATSTGSSRAYVATLESRSRPSASGPARREGRGAAAPTPYRKSCQNATAELAATFSESTPCAIGMMTERSQAESAWRERP